MILKSWRVTVFGETIDNVRKHRDINQTERKINYLVSEPNYQNTKFFTKTLVAVEMKKKQKQKNRDTYEQTCPFRTFNTTRM